MLKVLIAEDDITLVDVYRIKLESNNCEVRVALDGEQAINILSSYHPDVILLDILMPKKDGFETLKEIKSNAKWKHIPVIITTNLSQSSDQEKAFNLGATDFLVKSNTSLQEIINKLYKHTNSKLEVKNL